MENNKTFSLFSTCIPVRGYKRSIIYDLNRYSFYYVPNDLIEVIKALEKKSLGILEKEYSIKEWKIVGEYIKYLVDLDLGFYLNIDDKNSFPQIDLYWDYPEVISNIILQYSLLLKKYIKIVLQNIDKLNCSSLEIRIQNTICYSELVCFLDIFNNSIIQTIDIILYKDTLSKIQLEKISKNNRLRKIIILSSTRNYLSGKIHFIKTGTSSQKKISISKREFFTVNINFFSESQEYNTYFNRKLYINAEGNIYNSPETINTYGNIFDNRTNILNLVSSTAYQKLWRIPKTKIEPCNICEYRFMCLDNRIPLLKSKPKGEIMYFFTEECEYNPISMKWSDDYEN